MMSRTRDPSKYDKQIETAHDIYTKSKGEISLEMIARIVGVTHPTVMKWKKKYNWPDFADGKTGSLDEKFSSEERGVMDLTAQQTAFCHNYIKHFNASQALLDAGYSEKNARIVACNMLKVPKIRAYLKKLKKIHDLDDYLTTKRIIERHKQIAFADMSQFFDENLNPKKFSEVDGTLIKKVNIKKGKGFSFSIELEDRQKSLEFLTKFYGLDPDLEWEKKKKDNDIEDAEVVNIIDDVPNTKGDG